jgi:hypothetical protein
MIGHLIGGNADLVTAHAVDGAMEALRVEAVHAVRKQLGDGGEEIVPERETSADVILPESRLRFMQPILGASPRSESRSPGAKPWS